jgi:A/G-specific adenine glycosylase
MMMEKFFTKALMFWHQHHNKRQMPWKGEKNAYRIWLSEIILQQTRVEQGLHYYHRFVEKYPTIQDLANADDQEVFKLWEGLGYYNRCKNLLHTARTIVAKNQGVFPETYESIIDLKGIGPYTAAAIASFAFQLPYAVVDGNVYRVLSRYFNISIPIDSSQGKELYLQLANNVLDKKQPGLHNQAIMDLGATICKPFLAACFECPLQKKCQAFEQGTVHELPIKEKRLQKRKRWFNYFIFEYKGKYFLQQRKLKDIWENLFEFFLLESPELVSWDLESIQECLSGQLGIKTAIIKSISPLIIQQLTHQQIKATFIHIQVNSKPKTLLNTNWVSRSDLQKFPFPKIILQWMEQFPTI